MKGQMAKLRLRRWWLVGVVAAIPVIVVGCKKGDDGSDVVSVPKQLQTDWYGGSHGSTLTINDTGLVTKDLICSGNYKLSAISASGTGAWKYVAMDGDKKFTGTIKLGPDATTFDISSDLSGCYNEGLSGKFKRTDSIVFPEKLRGTWYSCDVSSCSKVKVILTTQTINVTGTGGGDTCVSDTATIKDISVDGPITKVKHTGLRSSGWDLSITQGGDGIDLSGTETLDGHYTSSDCTGTARSATKKTGGGKSASTNSGGGGGDCESKCMATQNACVMRCSGKNEHDTQVCVGECAAKGQECIGGC